MKKVGLHNNLITRFVSGFIMTMLKLIASSTQSDTDSKFYASVDPFDSVSDPFDLAWLMRDNRDMLSPVALA